MPQPRHTETSILQSYLLPPSTLPTILPYSSFLQLVPTQHRSHPHLKRLYRDLQFQRNVDVDTVRENIDREVSKSASLKADLARRIANDKGQKQHRARSASGADGASRKRKRPSVGAPDDEAGSVTTGLDYQSKPQASNRDESTNEIDTALDTTYYTASLHPSHPHSATSHPLTSGVTTLSRSKYHTTTSLLSSMDVAVADVDDEIADLDAESVQLLAEVEEIVGSLSDLRYGKFAKRAGGSDGKETSVEGEILGSLKRLEEAVRRVV